jgi:Cu(I)/Ag(I) efflux system membrane fusion protein
MKTRNLVIAIAAASLLGASGYGIYRIGVDRGKKLASPLSGSGTPESIGMQQAGRLDPQTGKRILYWHDPMVPGQKFDKPGKSPFMDMQLVPVYADNEGDEAAVTVSPRMQQNLGIRTAEVIEGSIAPAVEAVGTVAYNEHDLTLVQARSNGFVEKLYVRAPLDRVRKGQPLAELYVPEWVSAQEEYLSARRISSAGLKGILENLTDGARQRMRLAGMTEDQIRLVESTGKVHPRFTVHAPISGVIVELGAREGMTVMSGAPLFRINGLDTVWVNAEVRENQVGDVQPNNRVEARTPAFPGMTFKGKVNALLPEVNQATRTIKARIELSNPGGQLTPGMFVTVSFTQRSARKVLLVPTEAVIQTGKRSVVIVEQDAGHFIPVDVDVGIEVEGKSEIRKGLEAGQKVVVSGQFLIDSEASLKAATQRMEDAPATSGNESGQIHRGQGKVEKIGDREITLSHGPIASLQWEAMTMDFRIPAAGLPKNIAVGDTVAFELRKARDGQFELTLITPLAPESAGTPSAHAPTKRSTPAATDDAMSIDAASMKK